MTTHELKTWPEFYQALLEGRKRHEVRVDDRGFQVGDRLRLIEWDPELETPTGRVMDCNVTYLMRGGDCPGLEQVPANVAVMSVAISRIVSRDESVMYSRTTVPARASAPIQTTAPEES